MSGETVVLLTVRATVDSDALARHLTTDTELQQIIREGGAAGALVTHLTPMLEDPCWDSPAVLRVTAAVPEGRTVRVLTLTDAEEAALAGLLQWEAPDDGPLLDLLERLCPTITDPEEDWL